jgi:hypothetical protein
LVLGAIMHRSAAQITEGLVVRFTVWTAIRSDALVVDRAGPPRAKDARWRKSAGAQVKRRDEQPRRTWVSLLRSVSQAHSLQDLSSVPSSLYRQIRIR